MTNVDPEKLQDSFGSPGDKDKDKDKVDEKSQKINKNSNDIKNLDREVKSIKERRKFILWFFGILNSIALIVFTVGVTSFFKTISRVDRLHGRIDNFGNQVNEIHQILKNQTKEVETRLPEHQLGIQSQTENP